MDNPQIPPVSACDYLRTDHRQMETQIDRLLNALRRIGPESVPEVQVAVQEIRYLSSIHFEKEEVIFYPSLRLAFPDLLAQLDRQHEEVRELEQNVADLLSDSPQIPDSRWLNELRLLGTELHDLIQHHIVEEEDQLFRLAEDRLSREDQERLALQLEALHRRLCTP